MFLVMWKTPALSEAWNQPAYEGRRFHAHRRFTRRAIPAAAP
jgi:hypothetical protein